MVKPAHRTQQYVYQAQPGKQMRHHFVKRAIGRVINDYDSLEKALDVGCGTGEIAQYILDLAPNMSVSGIDLLDHDINLAKKEHPQIDFCVSDIISYQSQSSYDLITAVDVIEHIGEDEAALLQMNRLLSVGGILLISIPHEMLYWTKQDQLGGHYRRYTKKGIAEKLEHAGFSVLHSSTYGFPIPVLWLYLKNLLNRTKRYHEENLMKSRSGLALRLSSLLRYLLFINMDIGIGLNLLVVSKKIKGL